MEDETIKRIILLSIGLIVVVVFYLAWDRMSTPATETVAGLIPDTSCPKGARIDDYVNRMRVFASEESSTSEPAYALTIFKEYLGCKNPKVGNSAFRSDEIAEKDPEILACAKAAYINYGKELEEKKSEAAGSEEDVDYYTTLIEQNQEEMEIFNKVFPDTGGMCNYQATGRGTVV